MTGITDPATTIIRIYNKEMRQIPYPAFLKCFDKLCAAPPDPEPAPPADDLKTYFKAVCMSIERGISDTMGRGEDRVKEFYKHIYPVWKKSLPEEKFREYQDILDGNTQRMLQQREKELHDAFIRSSEEIERGESSPGNSHLRFEKALHDALKEEDLREKRQEAGEKTAESESENVKTKGMDAEAKKTTQQNESESESQKIPVLSSANHLCEKVRAGKLQLHYTGPGEKAILAAYRLDDVIVKVRMVQTAGAYYLYLSFPKSFVEHKNAEQYLLSMTSRLGYVEKGKFEYQKDEREYLLRLKFGKKNTALACRSEKKLSPEAFQKALRELDSHLKIIANELT